MNRLAPVTLNSRRSVVEIVTIIPSQLSRSQINCKSNWTIKLTCKKHPLLGTQKGKRSTFKMLNLREKRRWDHLHPKPIFLKARSDLFSNTWFIYHLPDTC